MGKKQCVFRDTSGTRCSHQNYNLSVYCYWHDPKAKKNQPDVKEKLLALYKAGESLEGYQLKGADLSNINLSHANLSYCNLNRANLSGAHLHGCDLSHCTMIKSDLKGANLNQSNLTSADVLGVQYDKAKMERIQWGDVICQEKRALETLSRGELDLASQYFIEAEEVYRSLYRACEDRGLYDEASKFYHRDRIMRRFQMPFPSKDWLASYLVDVLCGYGERPLRVVIFSMCIIFIWALLYSFIGVLSQGEPLFLSSEGSWAENFSVFFHCLYFSVVTFTTLGYGDVTPFGYAKILAATEAFVGSFTIAIFVVVFVKKMTR